MELADRAAELIDLGGWLDPNSFGTRDDVLPADGTFLRMYPQGGQPRAGSLRTDTLDVNSNWHFHDLHQLVYAFEGAVEVESGGGRHLVPRQLAAWIPAGIIHRLGLRRIKSGSVFFPSEAVANAGDRVRTVVVSPLMREMLRESMRWPLQAEETRLRKAFYSAMAGLCGEWIATEADLFLPTCRDRRLQRALDYTYARPDCRLGEICDVAGISERTLRRRLKSETGLSWEAYRQRQRILRAVTLLSETDEPITRIAAACGFESPSAFAKAFRQALSVSPSEFRHRAGGS